MEFGNSMCALRTHIANEIPEVINFTRIRNDEYPLMSYKDKAFSEERFYWVDSTFFNLFTIPFIEGDPNCIDPAKFWKKQHQQPKIFWKRRPDGKDLKCR